MVKSQINQKINSKINGEKSKRTIKIKQIFWQVFKLSSHQLQNMQNNLYGLLSELAEG